MSHCAIYNICYKSEEAENNPKAKWFIVNVLQEKCDNRAAGQCHGLNVTDRVQSSHRQLE